MTTKFTSVSNHCVAISRVRMSTCCLCSVVIFGRSLLASVSETTEPTCWLELAVSMVVTPFFIMARRVSGTTGKDGVPLSIVNQPLTLTMIEQHVARDRSRDVSDESQKQSTHHELLDWARVFRAAANRGKLTPAIGRSIRAPRLS